MRIWSAFWVCGLLGVSSAQAAQPYSFEILFNDGFVTFAKTTKFDRISGPAFMCEDTVDARVMVSGQHMSNAQEVTISNPDGIVCKYKPRGLIAATWTWTGRDVLTYNGALTRDGERSVPLTLEFASAGARGDLHAVELSRESAELFVKVSVSLADSPSLSLSEKERQNTVLNTFEKRVACSLVYDSSTSTPRPANVEFVTRTLDTHSDVKGSIRYSDRESYNLGTRLPSDLIILGADGKPAELGLLITYRMGGGASEFGEYKLAYSFNRQKIVAALYDSSTMGGASVPATCEVAERW
jgi:uncharacterized lipoprotein YbaY